VLWQKKTLAFRKLIRSYLTIHITTLHLCKNISCLLPGDLGVTYYDPIKKKARQSRPFSELCITTSTMMTHSQA